MVEYKVHVKFRENGQPLNEIVTNVLKIELEKNAYRKTILEEERL